MVLVGIEVGWIGIVMMMLMMVTRIWMMVVVVVRETWRYIYLSKTIEFFISNNILKF